MRAPAGCRIRGTRVSRVLGGPHGYSTGCSVVLTGTRQGTHGYSTRKMKAHVRISYLSSNSSICSHGPSPTPIITMLIANLHRQHDRFPTQDECVRAHARAAT